MWKLNFSNYEDERKRPPWYTYGRTFIHIDSKHKIVGLDATFRWGAVGEWQDLLLSSRVLVLCSWSLIKGQGFHLKREGPIYGTTLVLWDSFVPTLIPYKACGVASGSCHSGEWQSSKRCTYQTSHFRLFSIRNQRYFVDSCASFSLSSQNITKPWQLGEHCIIIGHFGGYIHTCVNNGQGKMPTSLS